MARYSSGGPADWAMFQQGRRDDQLRDILNTMMALKQYKDESGWRQKEYDYRAQQDELQNARAQAMADAQVAANESLVAQRSAPKMTAQEQLTFDLNKLEAEERIKAKYRDKGGNSEKPAYDAAAKSYIDGIARRYDDAIGDLTDPMKSMGVDNAKGLAANLAIGRSELSRIQKKLAQKLPLTENDWLMLDRLDSGMGVVQEKGAWWMPKPAAPRAMPEPKAPASAPAAPHAYYATGRGGRIWSDDGTTWFDEKTGKPVK